MKDIKKLLSENRSDVLPDDGLKERIRHELGYDDASPALAYAHGGQTAGSRKKFIIAAGAAAAAAVIALSVILPVALRGGDPGTNTPGLPGNKFSQITDADSFYAYGAVSVGTILSAADNTELGAFALTSASVRDRDDDDDDDDDDDHTGDQETDFGNTEDVAATVNRYMALVESLLGEGSIEGTVAENVDGYDCMMTVAYTDLLGGSVSYTMYYDKTLLSSETDDDETEEDYSLEGVLVVGNERYPVEGSYETETNGEESDAEMNFRAYMSDDRRSYIAVEQEHESESEDGENETETEYVYSVYRDGELVERTTVEYEAEDDELELKLTITADGRTETLAFSDETEDGDRVLRVSGNIDGTRVSFRIYVESGEYRYVFDDGREEDWERDR